jgi:phage terminase large subunit-like protein
MSVYFDSGDFIPKLAMLQTSINDAIALIQQLRSVSDNPETSPGRYPPAEWARIAVSLYGAHAADRIVAERNNGGDMVEATIRMVDPNVPLTTVRATRGKVVRAEPAAVLYEQSRIHHVGSFPTLEDQMCGFTSDFDRATAGFSPDRVDALVWALTDLLVEPMPYEGLMQFLREQAEREGPPLPPG